MVWKRFLSDNDRQQRKQNMSSPSPVTDGTHVWVMTGTGWLRAFDFDGNELWARNISDDYWSFGLNWGFASSPLLHEDALYVQVLHGMRTDDPSYVLRIDTMTGETVWMVERPTNAQRESPDSYTTPALLQYDGVTEIVLTGGDVVTGHDPETGVELWRADGLNPRNNGAYRLIASPLVVGDVIIAPTRVRPMLALKAGGRGDVTTSHRLWSFDDGPDVPTPVSDGELLYVVQDNGVVHALDLASGETVYTDQRIEPGTYSASPILADGKVYATSEGRGDDRLPGRSRVRDPRDQLSAGLHAEHAVGVRRTSLHPGRRYALLDRRAGRVEPARLSHRTASAVRCRPKTSAPTH